MKAKRFIPILGITALLISSCGDDETNNITTPSIGTETEYGVAAVSFDLSGILSSDSLSSDGSSVDGLSADDFVVEISGMTYNESDGTYSLPAGEHDVLVYNTSQGISVTDGIAYVDESDGTTRALSDFIDPMPDHLYSATEQVLIVAGETTNLDLDIEQRTRDLRIELTVTGGDPESIVSITGMLSGVAGAYDMWNETLYGDPVSTSPEFTLSGDQITADLRILGMSGDVQTLTLYIVFADGETQEVESDLTGQLADFNSGTTAFTLTGDLYAPTEGGYASITGWETVTGDSVTAKL